MCQEHSNVRPGDESPTERELQAPGGATPEEVARHVPQEAHEIFNAADFARPDDPGVACFSYGELIPAPEVDDYGPFVRRAEAMVALCAIALQPETVAANRRTAITGRTAYCVGPPSMAVVELHLAL